MAVNISEEKVTIYDTDGSIKKEIKLGKVDRPEDRILIEIPPDGEYIEILGHKIYGYNSFKEFRDHLAKYSELEYENKIIRHRLEVANEYIESRMDNMIPEHYEDLKYILNECGLESSW